MGGFIGHGRGVDKIDEVPFVSLHVRCGRVGCAAVSRGCLLRSWRVFSDRGGETWSPSCARSFAQIVFPSSPEF